MIERILHSAQRYFKPLSIIGLLLITTFLVIVLIPLHFGAVNTDFTLSLWSMPIIYNLNNGDWVGLAVPGNESLVETEFYTRDGCRDATTASYTGIGYEEEIDEYHSVYYNIINLEVRTDRLPYATAIARFDVEVVLMKDGAVVEYLFVKRDGFNVQTDFLNFTEVSKFGDGSYTIVYRGLAKYSINTLVEVTNETRELDFGCLNVIVENQKVTYVHHKFNVIEEVLTRKTINPILFKLKTWAPLVIVLGAFLQTPSIISYIKQKNLKLNYKNKFGIEEELGN